MRWVHADLVWKPCAGVVSVVCLWLGLAGVAFVSTHDDDAASPLSFFRVQVHATEDAAACSPLDPELCARPSRRSLVPVTRQAFLRLHFLNPFEEAHRLKDMFINGHAVATLMVLSFIVGYAAVWPWLQARDARPLVRAHTRHVFQLHMLLFGRVDHSNAAEAALLVVDGRLPVERLQALGRRGVLGQILRFLLLKLWKGCREWHSWLSAFYPTGEEALTFTRAQRAALMSLEMLANTLFVGLTLGSKQNTMLQIVVVAALTVAVVKLLTFPAPLLFELVNMYSSLTLPTKKHSQPSAVARLDTRLHQQYTGSSGVAPAIADVLRFHFPSRTRPTIALTSARSGVHGSSHWTHTGAVRSPASSSTNHSGSQRRTLPVTSTELPSREGAPPLGMTSRDGAAAPRDLLLSVRSLEAASPERNIESSTAHSPLLLSSSPLRSSASPVRAGGSPTTPTPTTGMRSRLLWSERDPLVTAGGTHAHSPIRSSPLVGHGAPSPTSTLTPVSGYQSMSSGVVDSVTDRSTGHTSTDSRILLSLATTAVVGMGGGSGGCATAPKHTVTSSPRVLDDQPASLADLWHHAVLSIFCTLQTVVGMFVLGFGLYLQLGVKHPSRAVGTVVGTGVAVAAAGVAAFVLVRVGRVRAALLACALSLVLELVAGAGVAAASVSEWRVIVGVVGGVHALLLALALLVVVQVVRSFKRSRARQLHDVTALAALCVRMGQWETDIPARRCALAAVATIVRGIRRRHARVLLLRLRELRVWEGLTRQRAVFRSCVYLFLLVVGVWVAFISLVYICTFTSQQALSLLYGMIAVILYDALLFDPLLVLILVGVRFVYQLSHRDVSAVLLDGRAPAHGRVSQLVLALFQAANA